MIRGVDTAAAVLPLRRKDTNLPNAGRLITALRQIGYNLEQAIADLIDNSVNAGAHHVLVRFLHDGNRVTALAVVDDGAGMSGADLDDAMRFGSRDKGDPATLGKFGMGMKLASLSHARSVAVLSRSGNESSARRWTVEGITSGWWCEQMLSSTASDLLDRSWGTLDLSRSGTVVLWENIDRLPSHRSGLKHTLGALERRLRLHLGLCFHRFIETGRLSILMDQLLVHREGQGLQSEIAALNPFGYDVTGAPSFPKRLEATLTGIGQLSLDAHIWPANSEMPEYKLGRRASSRQGLYFYRNDRLIQAGGWNGLVQDETEPHGSLARVSIDLPVAYDEWFGINVQKSNVLVPPVFAEVLDAVANDRTTFEDFRRSALNAYRSVNQTKIAIAPIPAKGLPAFVLNELQALYGHGQRNSQQRGFAIAWQRMTKNEFFRMDRAAGRLLINSIYRPQDSNGSHASDVIKFLLSLLMRRDVASAVSGPRAKEIAVLNSILVSLSAPD